MGTSLPANYPLISAQELKTAMAEQGEQGPEIKVLDCRFELADLGKGPREFAQGHIPGASYVHIDHDMCGEKTGTNGRHPLPPFFEFVQKTQCWGLSKEQIIIAMDAQNTMVSGRLWWMLRWAGYGNVKVLDGGWQAWLAAGGPVEGSAPSETEAACLAEPVDLSDFKPSMATVEVDSIVENIATGEFQIIDGRDEDRFLGRADNLDPVLGHIPGADNRCFLQNQTEDGKFKSPEVLKAEFETLLKGRKPEEIVHSCGSGVTACNNLLAMEIAGLSGSKLYPGSWSEYCSDPSRPVEVVVV
ncbi:MAG: sulfurtransferase [Burkholderiales bacterium]|nr:sulfurtransferase [Burkholderiales bacterium]